MMKLTARALTCLAVASFEANVVATKMNSGVKGNTWSTVATDLSVTTTQWCSGNVFPFPDKDFTVGMSSNALVFDGADLQQLQTVLGSTPAWSFDREWEFKAKVTSSFRTALNFKFPDGDGGDGFLRFTVPANASGETVQVHSAVKAPLASDVSLTYAGNTSDLMPHQVIFSQVCLRQEPCVDFAGCLPSHKYKPNVSANGDNFESCCEPILCKDTVTCAPATQYAEYDDADTHLGNTIDLCCSPRLCSAVQDQVCSDSAQPKHGSGLLGSTSEECCELSYCRDFTGCDPSHDTSALPPTKDDGTPRIGSTEEECCNIIECAAFNCSKSDLWTSKSNSSGLSGHSFAQCCEPLYCANYTCTEATKYEIKSNPPVQGNSDERCCDAIYCSDYTCSNSSITRVAGASTHLGSTDDECCERALCEYYTCSDPTKFWKKPHLVENEDGLAAPRFGASDEECCTPLYCKDFSCTSTRWKKKEELNETLLGWSHEQCCDKVLCENYTCTSDFDGDGNGTKWYKKADTNALKWQGSIDEECCYPLYCSQFVTAYPTEWKRKTNTNPPLLGSTEPECYDKVLCSNFCGCDKDKGLKQISDASSVQGSTVDQCCENITVAGSSSA